MDPGVPVLWKLAALALPDRSGDEDAVCVSCRGGAAGMDVTLIGELNRKVARRWFAWQDHTGIARDLGMRPAQVRSRANALGLPSRSRKTVTDYIAGRSYDRTLEESWVARRRVQGI